VEAFGELLADDHFINAFFFNPDMPDAEADISTPVNVNT